MTGGVFKFHSSIARNTVLFWDPSPKRSLGGAGTVPERSQPIFETSPERSQPIFETSPARQDDFFSLSCIAGGVTRRWKFTLILVISV